MWTGLSKAEVDHLIAFHAEYDTHETDDYGWVALDEAIREATDNGTDGEVDYDRQVIITNRQVADDTIRQLHRMGWTVWSEAQS